MRLCIGFGQDWNLDDPPKTDPGDLSEYRRVRDECKAKCQELLAKLKARKVEVR